MTALRGLPHPKQASYNTDLASTAPPLHHLGIFPRIPYENVALPGVFVGNHISHANLPPQVVVLDFITADSLSVLVLMIKLYIILDARLSNMGSWSCNDIFPCVTYTKKVHYFDYGTTV